MIRIAVQRDPIDVAAEAVALGGHGAVATFIGSVRADDGVTALELDHYPGMTEDALRRIADDAERRWALDGVTIVHRGGRMMPGEAIVFVAAAAPHRAAALDACACMIDRLKTEAPFWKRETRGEHSRWVEPRAADAVAAARWTD